MGYSSLELRFIINSCTAYYTRYCGFVKEGITKYGIAAFYIKKFPILPPATRMSLMNGKVPFSLQTVKKGLKYDAEYSIIQRSGLNIIPAFSRPKMKGDFFMKKSFGTLPSGEAAFLTQYPAASCPPPSLDYGATVCRKNGTFPFMRTSCV